MKISVKHVRTEGHGPLNWRFFVEATIESGWLFKKTRAVVYGRKYGGVYRDIETGETSSLEVDRAIEALSLREGIQL